MIQKILMKYTSFQFMHKITLIFFLSVLVISTISCTDNQITSPQIEITATPDERVNSNFKELPKFVKSTVLSDATKRFSKPVTDLRITQAQKQNWEDSCLGLAEPGKFCAQVIVPGWKVVVSDGKSELVYRTDEKGRQVKLEDSQT
ncbi:MAG: hypothetical protein AAFW70_20810 [Cyanobacteria bacterium J06635_10]